MKNNVVDIYEIELSTGKTIKYVKQFGKEYNDKPTTGWKLGEIV
jgi:hypothetical protein